MLPLAAAAAGYLLRGLSPRLVALLAVVASAGSAGLAGLLLRSAAGCSYSLPWISLPDTTEIPLAFHATQPILLFALSTALISVAVTVFALRERQGDPQAGSFFATLALFTGAMQLFLVGDTLLLIYFAWELMGLCSYLLIAHPGTDEARRAARRAFWTTRATDFGLLFAILIWMGVFNWVRLSQLTREGVVLYGDALREFAQRAGLDFQPMLQEQIWWLGIALLLVIFAVIGKSALLPLSFWLPDAMVAPAPVSALLHAATMVAAGPLLLYQIGGLFIYSQAAIVCATLFGAATLLAGAVMALCSDEPKRILAYSTVSHLGLAVLGAGVLTAEAGYIHLLAHAWFKAALFVGVGILAAQHIQSAGQAVSGHAARLNELAGSAAGSPVLKAGLLLSGLSLAGIWGLGGYFGKEQTLLGLLFRRELTINGIPLATSYPVAAACWSVAAVMLVLSLAITAAYIVRLVGTLVLPAGTVRDAGGEPGPAPPAASTGWAGSSLAMLALALAGSIGLGMAWPALARVVSPDGLAFSWNKGGLELVAVAVSLFFVLLGGGLAWYMNFANPAAAAGIAQGDNVLAGMKRFFGEGMYLREFWLAVANRCGLAFATLSAGFDGQVVDRLAMGTGRFGRAVSVISAWFDNSVVDGLRFWVCETCWLLKRLFGRTWQTGRIQHYMFIILVATVVMCYVVAKPMAQQVAPAIINFIEEGLL